MISQTNYGTKRYGIGGYVLFYGFIKQQTDETIWTKQTDTTAEIWTKQQNNQTDTWTNLNREAGT